MVKIKTYFFLLYRLVDETHAQINYKLLKEVLSRNKFEALRIEMGVCDISDQGEDVED